MKLLSLSKDYVLSSNQEDDLLQVFFSGLPINTNFFDDLILRIKFVINYESIYKEKFKKDSKE